MYENFDINLYNNLQVDIKTSIDDEYTKVWKGFTHKKGDKFPDELTKKRAELYTINETFYRDSLSDMGVYSNRGLGLYNFTIMDSPTDVMPVIRNPYYKYITDSWVGLLLSQGIKIDIADEKSAEILDTLQDAKLVSTLEEVTRQLLQCGNAPLQIVKYNDKIELHCIPCKNWIPYKDEKNVTSIGCNEVYNTYNRDGEGFIEFIDFLNDGTVERHTFKYDNGTIGEEVESDKYKQFEGIETSSFLVFTINKMTNALFGSDEYRYWASPIFLLNQISYQKQRLLNNASYYRANVPKSMVLSTGDENSRRIVSLNGHDNINVLTNEPGDIINNEKNIEIAQMDISNIKTLQEVEIYTIKRLAFDCGLGLSYFDTVQGAFAASGESQRIAMRGTINKARLLSQSMTTTLKELIKFIGLLYGSEFCDSAINIEFFISMLTEERNSDNEGSKHTEITTVQEKEDEVLDGDTVESTTESSESEDKEVSTEKGLRYIEKNSSKMDRLKSIQKEKERRARLK